MKTRNYVFTVNNPEYKIEKKNNIKLFIYNTEVGENGTVHYQGYVEMVHPVGLKTMKNIIPKGHLEPRKGTKYEAIKYCLKNYLEGETGIVEESFKDFKIKELEELDFGLYSYGVNNELTIQEYLNSIEICEQPKLIQLKKLIDEGKEDREIAEHDFITWSRSFRALERYRLLVKEKRTWQMDVVVIFGPTGTGKSRYCADTYRNAYWKQKSNWWDGYNGEETIILDEFYGWLKFDVLLRLLDRYPFMIETKGGQMNFTSKRIVITSNKLPEDWYTNEYFDALKRRITTYKHFKELDILELTFDNYEDFKDDYKKGLLKLVTPIV